MIDKLKFELHNEDCVNIMAQMEDNSIDLTVTSPPYDNLRQYNGNIDQWCFDKFKFNFRSRKRIDVYTRFY